MAALRSAVWWALLLVIALRPWALEFIAAPVIAQVERAGFAVGTAAWLLRRRDAPALPRLTVLACGILVLAGCQAVLAGGAARPAVRGLLFGIAVWMGVSSVGPREQRQLLLLLTCLGAAVAAHALWQAFVLFPALSRLPWHDLGFDAQTNQLAEQVIARRRVFGPFPLPGLLAAALGLLLPLSVSTLHPSATTPARRILALAVWGCQGAALFLTQSLGGILALGAATAGTFLARPGLGRRQVQVAVLTAACIAALFVLRPELRDPGHPRNPIAQRWRYWQSAAAMIRDHPWRGAGPGGFAAQYRAYQRPGASPTRFAHNAWLQVWTDWGLLAVLGLAGLCVGSLRSAARGSRGLRIAIAAFWLLASIDITWSIGQVSCLWWTLLGLATGRPRPPPV
jgi:hypothetical protein